MKKTNHKPAGWEQDVHSKWCRRYYCCMHNNTKAKAKDKQRSRKLFRKYDKISLKNEIEDEDDI